MTWNFWLNPTIFKSFINNRALNPLIAIDSLLIFITQALSHGAGHTRPVKSGKLFVSAKRS